VNIKIIRRVDETACHRKLRRKDEADKRGTFPKLPSPTRCKITKSDRDTCFCVGEARTIGADEHETRDINK
jgi:hypothetical protein